MSVVCSIESHWSDRARRPVQSDRRAPEMREMVCRLLGIGTCNAKQILKQLNRSAPLHQHCRKLRHVLRYFTC